MDEIQQELENVTDDMDAMGALLDELAVLSNKAVDLDQGTIDKSIDQVGCEALQQKQQACGVHAQQSKE